MPVQTENRDVIEMGEWRFPEGFTVGDVERLAETLRGFGLELSTDRDAGPKRWSVMCIQDSETDERCFVLHDRKLGKGIAALLGPEAGDRARGSHIAMLLNNQERNAEWGSIDITFPRA